MEFLDPITGGLTRLLAVVLPFLFVLVIVVFVHELGHFLVARFCGVKVKAFSIGFGKEIFGFYDRYGTRWRFAWVPLGGYVRFMDDDNSASLPSREALAQMTPEERAGAFQTKPLAARAAIVAAGPIANFLLAIVIFTLTYTIMGMHVTAPRVDELLPDSAAAAAGFKVGDVILKIDGQPIDTFADMQRIVSGSADRELSVEVDRGGSVVALKVTPTRRELVDRFGNKMRVGQIGIRRNATQHEWEYRRYGPIEAFGLGVKETFFIITRTLQFLQELVMGRESTDQLRGPIGIAEISGQVATLGIMPLLNLVALISVSIGLINLFPIPLLDGGHLLFYGIEAVRRKPLSERTQEISFRIGLAIVLMLTIFVTWKDIVRSWLGGVG